MQILSIAWTPLQDDPDILSFPIEKDIAVNFLSGISKLQDYSISIVDGQPVLLKKVIGRISNVIFWNLKSIEEEKENFNFAFHDNIIEIHSKVPLDNYILYGSLKNDPSWLLNTWHLTTSELGNYTKLYFDNASNYSYFLRKIK